MSESREPMCGPPTDTEPDHTPETFREVIEHHKRELQAAIRGDDKWRHPDLYDPPSDDGEPTIQHLVIEDIQERERHGIRTYGRAIYADTPNDPVEGGPIGQAYREALDLVIYLRWFIERHGIEL